jgi:DNA-binding GntR family transcriptional regulator
MSNAPAPTKQRQVYDALRADIVGGALAPGQVLVIDALAKRFAVSIIPVREALRQLQAERLVEIRPHTGVCVAPVEIEALDEIFALLGALETTSALAALPKLKSVDLRALADLVDDLEAVVARGDSAAFEAANREFHLLPCRVAGFDRAREMLESLFGEWERLHRMAFRDAVPPDPRQANREHRAILRAFRRGEAEALGEAVRRHNAAAAGHYRALLRGRAD